MSDSVNELLSMLRIQESFAFLVNIANAATLVCVSTLRGQC